MSKKTLWSVVAACVVLAGLAVKLEVGDKSPAIPEVTGSLTDLSANVLDVTTNMPSTNVPTFNPNGFYGAYEPMVSEKQTIPAITVSKFVTSDNSASMSLIRPTTAGLYGPASNLMAVCIGSNWWWYANMPVSNVPAGSYFGINGYRYHIVNPAIAQYKVYPEHD